MRTARVPLWLPFVLLCAAPLPAFAQKYPEKAVRMVVAFPTGASHILAVLTAEKLREATGQPFVPDFRPGAGGNVAAEIVAKAPADGYTLLLTSGSIAISPSLFPKLGYDTFRDFAPTATPARPPNSRSSCARSTTSGRASSGLRTSSRTKYVNQMEQSC